MQVAQHATFSRDDHGLAEDLSGPDERWPDVGAHPGAGLLTGVVAHVHRAPVHPLLVLQAVARALKHPERR